MAETSFTFPDSQPSRAATKLSPSTLNLRLSSMRKLAREMADNGLLDPGTAKAIERTMGEAAGVGRELVAQRTAIEVVGEGYRQPLELGVRALFSVYCARPASMGR